MNISFFVCYAKTAKHSNICPLCCGFLGVKFPSAVLNILPTLPNYILSSVLEHAHQSGPAAPLSSRFYQETFLGINTGVGLSPLRNRSG